MPSTARVKGSLIGTDGGGSTDGTSTAAAGVEQLLIHFKMLSTRKCRIVATRNPSIAIDIDSIQYVSRAEESILQFNNTTSLELLSQGGFATTTPTAN